MLVLLFMAVLFAAQGAFAGQVVIMQYHHIDTSTPASTSLSPVQFAEHMHFLRDNGFTVLRLEDALKAIRNGDSLPDKAASITFDDAYHSVYTDAFPLLKALDYPFTIFISAGLVGDHSGLYSSWEELKEMGENGGTLANHTMTHPYLLDRPEGENETTWLKTVESEIMDAELMIEARTGQRHGLLAYPYGEYNREIQTLVTSLGLIGIGQQSGPVNDTSDFTAIPRFPFSGIYASMNTFRTKVGSLAFDIASVSPENRNTSSGNPEATLALLPGEYKVEEVGCFHNNEPMQLETEGNSITMNSDQRSSSRRFRYNCTAPGREGRYYWYSVDWVNPAVRE
jgi:peptidoglycan/xylan/chitin deacetylase (PgdA/CDA1 family)